MSVTLPADSADTPRVSAVIVSYNTRDHLLACVGSLERHVTLAIEIVIIDNASADDSVEAVQRACPAARIVRNAENVGFARACNQAIRLCRAPYVLLLNSDAEVLPGAVEALCDLLDSHPGFALAGPRTLNDDGTAQLSFGPDLTPLGEWRQRRLVRGVRRREPWALGEVDAAASREHEPDWLSGSCLLCRRSALESVGLFDEGFFLYEEDADLCLRLGRAGWHIAFSPKAEVRHRVGGSVESAPVRSRIEYHRSHLRYYRKHNGPLLTAALRMWMVASGAARYLASGARGRPEALASINVGLLGR